MNMAVVGADSSSMVLNVFFSQSRKLTPIRMANWRAVSLWLVEVGLALQDWGIDWNLNTQLCLVSTVSDG